MINGAFAMIDALGFKGIWRTSIPQDVLQKLHELDETTQKDLDVSFGGRELRKQLHADPRNLFSFVNAGFLSDTIVLAAATKDVRSLNFGGPAPGEITLRLLKALPLEIVAAKIASLIRHAVLTAPVLNYRGAITYGEFVMDDQGRFIVGPAVDDAAMHSEIANAAIIWLAPKAMHLYDETFVRAPRQYFLPYEVPLKGGSTIKTLVVNPFATCDDEEECEDLRRRMTSAFDVPSLPVLVKKQQTEKFLDAAMQHWTDTPRSPPAEDQEYDSYPPEAD